MDMDARRERLVQAKTGHVYCKYSLPKIVCFRYWLFAGNRIDIGYSLLLVVLE